MRSRFPGLSLPGCRSREPHLHAGDGEIRTPQPIPFGLPDPLGGVAVAIKSQRQRLERLAGGQTHGAAARGWSGDGSPGLRNSMGAEPDRRTFRDPRSWRHHPRRSRSRRRLDRPPTTRRHALRSTDRPRRRQPELGSNGEQVGIRNDVAVCLPDGDSRPGMPVEPRRDAGQVVPVPHHIRRRHEIDGDVGGRRRVQR